MVPVATVEQVGFQKLLKTMDPRYELPSRNYFAREALPQMYTEIRQSLADRLANVTHFALTRDMWSSRTCEPYMSVTVHFIQDWEMKTACLQTSYFPQDHTVGNTGSNIVKAVEPNEWLRMQCFGHRLHLAIELSWRWRRYWLIRAAVNRLAYVCPLCLSLQMEKQQ
ncbi:Zinc finger BED domain-containing protein 1 [Anabarilius grahami]|uniref:Zinc finger BED domain-containing protein 1 n=1 Tax=Anabarilius grahami TaxID=495550 RepID=A0A3N0YLY8_ANAGA|nr:Zinc finger BED domain-containing protein 1 [Anabarilius grahami]